MGASGGSWLSGTHPARQLFAKPRKRRNGISLEGFHRLVEPGKCIDCPFGRSLKIRVVPITIVEGDVTVQAAGTHLDVEAVLAVLADDLLNRLHRPILAGHRGGVEAGLMPVSVCHHRSYSNWQLPYRVDL